MRAMWAVGAMAGALLAAGCGEEPRNPALEGGDPQPGAPYEQLGTTGDTSQAYESEGAAPVVPVQGETAPGGVLHGSLTATGNLQGVAENAPPGSVVVSEYGPGTRVSIKIDRYAPGSTLGAVLVRGNCQQTGQVVAQVGEPITVGNAGFATLTTDLSVPARTVLDGGHSIRIHTPPQGSPQIVLACADLPAARQ